MIDLESRIDKYCEDCNNAEWDYVEFIGGTKQWFRCGCKKGLEPEYNEETDDLNCDSLR